MKKWYQSKTVWFNTVMTIVDFVAIAQTTLGPDVEPRILMGLALLHGLGNVILRIWFTTSSVQDPL